jgi:excisionase family DNA binding protein
VDKQSPANVLPFPRHAASRVLLDAHGAAYTVAQVAESLQVSEGLVYKWLRCGELPGRLLGRRWIIPVSRFHTWLDNLPVADPGDVDPHEPDHDDDYGNGGRHVAYR